MKSQPPISADAIRKALDDAPTVDEAAAALSEQLGRSVSRRTLYRWIGFYGIKVTRLLRAA